MKAVCVLCGKPTRLDVSRVPAGCECRVACFPVCPRPVTFGVRHPECHDAFMRKVEEESQQERLAKLSGMSKDPKP